MKKLFIFFNFEEVWIDWFNMLFSVNITFTCKCTLNNTKIYVV